VFSQPSYISSFIENKNFIYTEGGIAHTNFCDGRDENTMSPLKRAKGGEREDTTSNSVTISSFYWNFSNSSYMLNGHSLKLCILAY
jgi:hypothetical protein